MDSYFGSTTHLIAKEEFKAFEDESIVLAASSTTVVLVFLFLSFLTMILFFAMVG